MAGNAVTYHTLLDSSSPPITLLHSTHVPTTEERQRVESTVAQISSSLRNMQSEICRLERSIQILKNQREKLEGRLYVHNSILSSVKRLPPEILGEILFLVRLDQGGVHIPARKNDNAMSMVCSYWRSVYVSFPKLWANLNITCSPTSDQGKHMACLAMCLTRSGQEPLTISLTTTGIRPYALVTVLASHSTRWASFSLQLGEGSFPDVLEMLDGIQNSVPHLRLLSLQGPVNVAPPNSPRHISSFSNSPSLRRIHLSNFAFPSAQLHLPWRQITHLSTDGSRFREGELRSILLQAADTLVSLTSSNERILEVASTGQPNQSTEPSQGPILLPHLRSLSLTNKGSYISKIFQILTLPSLTSLSVVMKTTFSGTHSLELIRLLRRSSSSGTPSDNRIHTLQIHGPLEMESDPYAVMEQNLAVHEVLTYCGSVRRLELRLPRLATELMPRLRWPERLDPNSTGSQSAGMNRSVSRLMTMTSHNAHHHPSVPSQTALARHPLPHLTHLRVEDTMCAVDNGLGGLVEMIRLRLPVPKAWGQRKSVAASIRMRSRPEKGTEGHNMDGGEAIWPPWVDDECSFEQEDGAKAIASSDGLRCSSLEHVEVLLTHSAVPTFPEIQALDGYIKGLSAA